MSGGLFDFAQLLYSV